MLVKYLPDIKNINFSIESLHKYVTWREWGMLAETSYNFTADRESQMIAPTSAIIHRISICHPDDWVSVCVGLKKNVCISNKRTISEVKSEGSRDILATARLESFPTRALYGASLP